MQESGAREDVTALQGWRSDRWVHWEPPADEYVRSNQARAIPRRQVVRRWGAAECFRRADRQWSASVGMGPADP